MTKKLKDAFIYLLVCASKNEKVNTEYIEDVSLDDIYTIASFHKVAALIGYALSNSQITHKKFTETIARSMKRQALFEIERKKIIDFLKSNDIPFMLLKGVIIEKYYPKTYLREMTDNDIFFDYHYLNKVTDYFIKNGYTQYNTDEIAVLQGCYSFHKEPVYNFEMHTKLFSDNLFKELNDYYGDVFSKLDKKENYEYEFNINDLYIFFTLHEYKHYNYAGTGLRGFVDNYLIRTKLKDELDFVYIDNELKKIGAYEFEKMRNSIVDKIFCDPFDYSLDENEEKLFADYLTSGVYGTDKHLTERILKRELNKSRYESEKLKRIDYLFRCFTGSKEIYEKKYPVLSKHKVFMPVCFVLRFFSGVFRGRISEEIGKLHKYK